MAKKTDQMIFKEEVADFLLDRAARRHSRHTLIFYQNELQYLGRFLEDYNIQFMHEIETQVLRRYFISLGQRRNKGGVHASFRAIKTFLNWYIDEHELEIRNPISKVQMESPSKRPVPGIPLSDISKLLKTCDKSFHGHRDRAIILFLLDSGVRREEMCNLNLEHLNMKSGAVQIKHGKGDIERTTYVEAKTLREVSRYMRFRSSCTPEDPLWISSHGGRLSVWGLRQIIRRRSVRAGIEEPGLHDFRRTFAIECLRNGCNIYALMRMMGHLEPSVLHRYLALVEEDVESAHKKSSPVENL